MNLCLRRNTACHLIVSPGPRTATRGAEWRMRFRSHAEGLGQRKVSRVRREQKMEKRPWQPSVRKICKTLFSITFDKFCVLLRRDGHSQLVYKHAISTIMPGHPIQLFEGADEPPAGDKV